MENLRDQLIGAWKLVSYTEIPVNGSAPFYPMSENPMGIIMYTPDGYMSAQLMHPDRKNFASGDWFKGSTDEYKEEASTYIAYTGPFHVDEEKQTLNFLLNGAAGTLLVALALVQSEAGLSSLQSGLITIGYLVAILSTIITGWVK